MPDNKICIVPDCLKPAAQRRMCHMHYMRQYRAQKTGHLYEPYTGPFLSPTYAITLEQFNLRYWGANESMEQIARDLGGWGAELRRLVLKAGGKLKTKRQAYDDRMKSGVGRTHFFDEQFFDEWSPAMAWVLGLIASDGCIDKRHHFWQITLADLDCLEQVAQLIGYEGSIHKVTRSACHVLKLSSTTMVRRLLELGLTSRKSITLQYPNMPDDMHRHFIRGYFDGDGSFTTQVPRSSNTGLVTGRVTLSTGSETFARMLDTQLIKDGIEPSLRISTKHTIQEFPGGHTSLCKPAHAVRLGGHSAARFYEYIYDGVPKSLSMKRKRDKYMEWYDTYAHIYANGPAPKCHNAVSCNQLSLGLDW